MFFSCPIVPQEFGFEVYFSQFLFKFYTHTIYSILAVIYILSKLFFTLAVTSLAAGRNITQRTGDLVVRELHCSIGLVGHVAISTRYSPLSVDTKLRKLIIGVLCLDNRSTTHFMNIVSPAFFVVVFFHFFHSHTFIPWESKIFLIPFEVVFYVALSTNQ